MCEVPPPSGNPHVRKLQPDEEEDLVDKLIRKSGCEEAHYKVQECMVEHEDWRKCQGVLKDFQACMNKGSKRK